MPASSHHSSKGGGSSNGSRKDTSQYTWLWSCCECRYDGMVVETTVHCSLCAHLRCKQCELECEKLFSHRSGSPLSEVGGINQKGTDDAWSNLTAENKTLQLIILKKLSKSNQALPFREAPHRSVPSIEQIIRFRQALLRLAHGILERMKSRMCLTCQCKTSMPGYKGLY
jgi:hypothetical protein